jgi:phosphate transport system substrate-binding protein
MSNRREYLSAVATGLTAAVGGCLSDGSEGSGDDEPTDTATSEPTNTNAAEETATEDSGATTLQGSTDITGSSTVFPVAQAVSERFKERESAVDFDIVATGTGGGFSERFCSGDADFNNASRPITSDEQRLCADNGVEYHRLTLARDAVTVVVNTDNDWLDCATTAQLRQIWRADGATTWADIDSAWPDEEIQRYGPADTSGTFDYFRREVVGEGAMHTSDYLPTEQDSTIVQGVQSDQYAIGYVGFAYYQQNSDAVTTVGIDDGDGCVEPSLETAESGKYPLARPLFTYVNTDRLGEAHVAEFARFFLEQSANEDLVADEVGYVPNTEAEMQAELDALNDAIADAQ